MIKLIKQFLCDKFQLVSFILLSGLFVSENVCSTDRWHKGFTSVSYDSGENSISIKFIVFDYCFMMRNFKQDHAYLSWCDFSFNTKGKKYSVLMRAETKDQQESGLTDVKMKSKFKGADLQFLGCFRPLHGSKWVDDKEVNVSLKNRYTEGNDKHPIAGFTVKWVLGDKFKGVKRIRLNGVWAGVGSWPYAIVDIDYEISKVSAVEPEENQSEYNRVKVAAKADAIVITGAQNGENIKVYNLAGVEVQSTVTNSDVVNIKLPKNQIYFVNVAQTRYKVVM